VALARAEKQSANRQARLTTILHTALHDAVLVTWAYALVRRERLSVPREVRLLASFGVLQWDAYIATHDAKYTYWRLRPNMADTTIVPLIPVPNHPAYVSNAAIIASVITALVGAMFPQETAQWQYLGEEAGLSRIYAGIHYPSDERAGNQMGKSIAALAIQRDQLNGP
jgi:hypothetical protein